MWMFESKYTGWKVQGLSYFCYVVRPLISYDISSWLVCVIRKTEQTSSNFHQKNNTIFIVVLCVWKPIKCCISWRYEINKSTINTLCDCQIGYAYARSIIIYHFRNMAIVFNIFSSFYYSSVLHAYTVTFTLHSQIKSLISFASHRIAV